MKTEFGVIRITTPPVAVNDYYTARLALYGASVQVIDDV